MRPGIKVRLSRFSNGASILRGKSRRRWSKIRGPALAKRPPRRQHVETEDDPIQPQDPKALRHACYHTPDRILPVAPEHHEVHIEHANLGGASSEEFCDRSRPQAGVAKAFERQRQVVAEARQAALLGVLFDPQRVHRPRPPGLAQERRERDGLSPAAHHEVPSDLVRLVPMATHSRKGAAEALVLAGRGRFGRAPQDDEEGVDGESGGDGVLGSGWFGRG